MEDEPSREDEDEQEMDDSAGTAATMRRDEVSEVRRIKRTPII